MEKREIVETLVTKYGAIEVSRNYIRGIRSALANVRNGIETNNIALAAKDVGLLAENLAMLEMVYGLGDKALVQLRQLDKENK